jgi:hypothetical protein
VTSPEQIPELFRLSTDHALSLTNAFGALEQPWKPGCVRSAYAAISIHFTIRLTRNFQLILVNVSLSDH